MPSEKAMHVARDVLHDFGHHRCQEQDAIHAVSNLIDAHTAAAVNEAVAEYKRVLDQVVTLLTSMAKQDVAIYEHTEGRKLYLGHKPTQSACTAMECLAAIEQLTKEKNV